ncbi:Leucine-rich repeats and immunoglobulin-like domains protein 3 [Trichinella pseudospiralis]|uniref:Leucine-rich repeats and immunoglobulin-like domains protein 3 n=1 Tax=Trichinella pseudospiralis TaxID=6337 RepID=A0A0V1FI20_TRIPS|nr:Leucine-rich repeats and immunoglobulin-like domains protein 3 [Trichinella pseudospiralis]
MLSTRITTITINTDSSSARITICAFSVIQASVGCASFVQAYSSITLIITRYPVRQVVTSSTSFSFPMKRGETLWRFSADEIGFIDWALGTFGHAYNRSSIEGTRPVLVLFVQQQQAASAFAHFVPAPEQLPRIHPPDQNVTVSENETATLECNVHGGYPPARLYWYKEPNEKIEPDNDKYIFDGERVLLIKQSEKSDAGNYRCVAENEVGKSVAQRRLFVTPPIRYLWTMCDEHGRAIKTTYVPARGDTPMINSPMLPWDTEVIDFPIINGSNNVFIRCLPSN